MLTHYLIHINRKYKEYNFFLIILEISKHPNFIKVKIFLKYKYIYFQNKHVILT